MQSQSLIPTSTADIMTTAKALSESGYFPDARSASQAFAKILAGAEIGISPFAAMNGIHIISGKPVFGSGLMASTIKRSGKYDYEVIESTGKVCSVDFYQVVGKDRKKLGNITFTIEEARKAGVKNLEKFPDDMLFARCISKGCRRYTPDVFGGPVYVEGEIEAEVVDGGHAQVVQEPAAEPVQEAKVVNKGHKRATAEAMKSEQEAKRSRAIDEANSAAAASQTQDDYDYAEDMIFKDARLLPEDKVLLILNVLNKRISACTNAADANRIAGRLKVWYSTVGRDSCLQATQDLTEQGMANGFKMVDTGRKKGNGYPVFEYQDIIQEEAPAVEESSLPY